jgi:hypothetical protein
MTGQYLQKIIVNIKGLHNAAALCLLLKTKDAPFCTMLLHYVLSQTVMHENQVTLSSLSSTSSAEVS